MPKSLGERFRATRASSLTDDDGLVFAVYRKRVKLGDSLMITRLKTSPGRAQVLNLHVSGGLLNVNGVAASAISLNSDTCPETISVVVESAEPDRQALADPPAADSLELEIWNGWVVDDVEHAWVGDAGIRLGATNPLTLECSDGLASGDFDDLIVEIEISPTGSASQSTNPADEEE